MSSSRAKGLSGNLVGKSWYWRRTLLFFCFLQSPRLETLRFNQYLTFMGLCIANVFSSATNKMQCYTIYLFLWNARHVSGGSSIIRSSNCKHSIGNFVRPLLLPSNVVAGSTKILTKYLMLYIQFELPMMDEGTSWNMYSISQRQKKLCNVTSCWLYLKIINQYWHVII